MNDIEKLNEPELLDLLAKYTSRYTQMLAGTGIKRDGDKIKEKILRIQAELEKRKPGKLKKH